jgi:hypothetical protein
MDHAAGPEGAELVRRSPKWLGRSKLRLRIPTTEVAHDEYAPDRGRLAALVGVTRWSTAGRTMPMRRRSDGQFPRERRISQCSSPNMSRTTCMPLTGRQQDGPLKTSLQLQARRAVYA